MSLNRSKSITTFFYLLCICTNFYAQEDVNFIDDTFKRYDLTNSSYTPQDSLLTYTYKDLKTKYWANKKDTVNSLLYAKAYVRKGKKEKKEKRLLLGYYLCQIAAQNNQVLFYGDSLIQTSRVLKIKLYEARGYFNKGTHYLKKRKFKLALDNQLIADSIMSKVKDNPLSHLVNYNIGLIRDILGEQKEALRGFKNSYEILKSINSKKSGNYFKSLFSLSNTYRKTKEIDSAMKYYKLGIIESKDYSKNPKYYYDFLLIKGMIDVSLDSIETAKKNINQAQNYYESSKIDHPNLIFCYYYNSIIDRINNEYSKSITGMHKVDSLYNKQGYLYPELTGTYEILISHYKSKNDLKKQLLYVERLLEIKNNIHEDYRYLYKNIANNYDTPKLLKNKEQLINRLANKNKKKEQLIHHLVNKNKNLYILFIPIILIISCLVLITYRKKRIYKNRLDLILQDTPITKKENTIPKPTKSEINISEDIRATIITGLHKFISQKEFIEKDITVGKLAKKIGTNAKYLAAIIKEQHDKSFVRFINDLRIEYAIEKLKTDPKFRLYTIQGIAELSGFGHTESFTRAFVKKTGIKVSYFLKNLK